MVDEVTLSAFDYGIASGALFLFFVIVGLVIRNYMKQSEKREVRAEERERHLLQINERLSNVVEKHGHALSEYSSVIEKVSVLVDKQSTVINRIAEQVDGISDVVAWLRQEYFEMRRDIDRIDRNQKKGGA